MFKSAVTQNTIEAAKIAPIRMPEQWGYCRKPAFHFGWDWGPRLVTCGIFKPVYLRGYDLIRIDNVLIKNEKIEDYRRVDKVSMDGHVELQILSTNDYIVDIRNGSAFDGFLLFTTKAKLLEKGTTKIPFTFDLSAPQLWWPRTLGNSTLYDFTFLVYSSDRVLLEWKTVRTGIRSIELVQDPDKKGTGQSFKFRINGVQFYAKGANYVPRNFFLPMGMRNPSIYEDTIKSAIDANFNMIRLWGGG